MVDGEGGMIVIKLLPLLGLILFQVPAGTALTTAELDADPTIWDGQMVTITGEIIGDYGRRSEVIWVQVNDDSYVDAPLVETGRLAGSNTGVGVRIPEDLFDDSWGPPGGYRIRGPVVEVTGVFEYADEETGGDTFIDAMAIELVDPARRLDLPGPDWRLVVISALAIAGGLTMGARARYRRLNPEG